MIIRNFKENRSVDFIGVLYQFYGHGYYSNSGYIILNCIFIHDDFGNMVVVEGIKHA